MDNSLNVEIDALKALIEHEEENYRLAITGNTEYDLLKKMRSDIRELRNDLQLLSGKDA